LPVAKQDSPLYGALDRFSQFFVKPLFLEDTLDRELRAVDSENKKNLQSDTWRMMQLNKSLSNKNHPYHLFSTGNYKTLHDEPIERGVKIREEFIKFYEKHYSANRMKLVVLGRESLDELQNWTEEFFTDVQDQDLPQLRWDDVPAQTAQELCQQTFVKPVMDTRMLDITFPYPDEEDLYASQPSRYISHLIGHEGPGSLLTYLKVKGWANELSAGASPVCPGTAFFSISLRLTTEGLKNYEEVVVAIFQYITMLKSQEPHEWIVEEQKKLAEVSFKYMQKIPASRTVSHLSGVMQKPLPRDWLLSGQSLIREFDPKAIRRGLDALRPDNFNFTVASQEFPGDWDKKEKWYGTDYKHEKIPEGLMQQLVAVTQAPVSQLPKELHLPAKNEFVPQRLDVERKAVDKPLDNPKLVRHDANVRVWHKKDDRFWVPKANLYVLLRTPLINDTPFTSIVTQLYQELVNDSLIEYAYDAELAGLGYDIGKMSEAFAVSIGGYNDKMHVLLEKVLVEMRDIEIKQDRFDIIKERLARGLKNFDFQEPFRQIGSYSRWLSKERVWSIHQLLEELPAVTVEDVRTFYPQILRQMHIELLVHGNLYKEDALRISDMVESVFKPRPLPQAQWRTSRNLILPPGCNYLYERILANPENVNHCIEYILHVGDPQERSLRAKLLLLSQMLEEPVFDTLRTKEQLGYIVSGGAQFSGAAANYRILIQSEKPCSFLEHRIDAFLVGFAKALQEMPQQEFDAHKIGTINKRLEKLKNLNQERGRMWHHITSEAFDFELGKSVMRVAYTSHEYRDADVRIVQRDVEALEPLSKNDIIEFFNTNFSPSSEQRAKVSVHLIAQGSSVAATTEDAGAAPSPVVTGEVAARDNSTQLPVRIQDVKAFKASLALSAGLQPVKDITEFEDLGAKL
jgi:insulysin